MIVSTAGQNVTPDVVKNHSEEVSHSGQPGEHRPPSSGSAHRGPPARSSSIFAANAP